MRLRTAQKTFLLFLLSTFVLVDVSESIAFAPAVGLLVRARGIPLFLRRTTTANKSIGSRILNKLKSLFERVLKIGDTVNGISDVKEYLEMFGYLNHSSNSYFTNEFTENLQVAIKKFQKNFNLSVTEQLDENTHEIMSQTRCGVTDFINGTTTMNSSDEVTNTTSFIPWWRMNAGNGTTELTYAFNPQNNVTNGVKSLFEDAFNKWSNVTSLKFNETTSYNGSDIRIVFVKIDGKGGVVGGADTNYSTHVGRIYLDSEEEWELWWWSSEEDEVDLESVVMHQIGHLLGLGHSSVEEAIMYPIVLPHKKTELVNNDDLHKIKQIYRVA